MVYPSSSFHVYYLFTIVNMSSQVYVNTSRKRKSPYSKSSRNAKKARTMPSSRPFMASSRSNSKFTAPPAPEQKWIGFNWGGTTAYVNNADTVTCFNPITQGNTSGTMVGRKCILKSLNFTFNIITPPLVAASFGVYKNLPVRVLFFYDKSNNGAAPAVTDLLVQQTTTSLRNLDNIDRFIMLYDKIFQTGQNSTITGSVTYNMVGGNLSETIKSYIKMSLPFDGPSTAGAVAGINSGAIFYLAIQDNAAVSSGTYITGSGRIRFTDA